MGSLAESFNQTGFSHFINSPAGRVFRIIAGLVFLSLGLVFRDHLLGIVSLVWSVFPLSAGVFDICYISAALGGPISGKQIRSAYKPH